ncbi:MAG: hypothetical protein IPO08_23565 [Xanthomonadales bacterium]|nr:hypothetical protein [Xanthomonadales bacterium]
MQSNQFSMIDVEAFAARFYINKDTGQPRPLLLTPYAYNITFASLAQGATATGTINISANADFILLMLHHRAQIGAAQNISTKTAPFVRVLITDSGSGEQFTNSAVDVENYSTNGNIINALSYPRIIAGRSSLTVQVTNFAPTAETYTSLDLMFDGVQVRAYQ